MASFELSKRYTEGIGCRFLFANGTTEADYYLLLFLGSITIGKSIEALSSLKTDGWTLVLKFIWP